MRESGDVCVTSVLGVRFFPFLVRDVKRGRLEIWRGRISWYPQDAIAAELKTQIFLYCTGLNVCSRLPYIFLVWPFRFIG